MANTDKHLNSIVKRTERVTFVGTASTRFDKGTGVCYNYDYGTATTLEGSRGQRVEVPSRSNNRAFAGVLDHNVTLDSTGTSVVTICKPGGLAEIALGVDTVINTGRLTCLAAGGNNTARFLKRGFKGRGSAIPLQTVTNVLESNLLGTGAISADGLTLTVSDSSDFVTGTLGSRVIILGGEDDGTGAVQPGCYYISSITNATTIVLTATCMDTTAASAGTCSYIITDPANSTCLAKLEDGDESGLVEVITPPNAGSTGMTYMVGGYTYVNAGITLAADADVDLAAETQWFSKKGFEIMGDFATNDFTVDLVVNGIQMDGSTALTEILTMDDDGDAVILEWTGLWHTRDILVGATEG
jgi:hypothetical protein